MNTVLFICTGNYYRSRLAEIIFNRTAASMDLPVRAISRGLKLWQGNQGAISPHTRAFLDRKNIDYSNDLRPPREVSLADFREKHSIIAMDRKEHLTLMQERFPDLATTITYWDFQDEYIRTPEEVLPAIEKAVLQFVDTLKMEYFHVNEI